MNFSGNKLLEGVNIPSWHSIADDDMVNDNLDFLVVAQYGRNPDRMG